MTFSKWYNSDSGSHWDLAISILLAAVSCSGGIFILTGFYFFAKFLAGVCDVDDFFDWLRGFATIMGILIIFTRFSVLLAAGLFPTIGFAALVALLLWHTIGSIFLDRHAPFKPPLFDY